MNVLSGPEEVSRGYAGSEESLNNPERHEGSRRGSEVSLIVLSALAGS